MKFSLNFRKFLRVLPKFSTKLASATLETSMLGTLRMIRAVIHLTIVNAMHSRANLRKVGAATWPLASGNFFLEREYLLFYSLSVLTFPTASGQVVSLIIMSIYIVYYYIYYIIRNIIKLIKRRDIDKRKKGARNSILPGHLPGHLRK